MLLKELRKAMGLTEAASVGEVRDIFDRLLQEEMTPEEQDEEKKRKEEAAAAKKREEMTSGMMTELRGLLGLNDDAGLGAVVGALRAIKGPEASTLTESFKGFRETQAGLALQVKELSERVKVLEPQAAAAVELQKVARLTERDRFLSEQARQGKMAPVDKPFYESMWELSEDKVRAHFKDKKAGSVVHVTESGSEGRGEERELAEDPREQMHALVEARMTEKKIEYHQALSEIKAEQPDLVAAVARLSGPPKR